VSSVLGQYSLAAVPTIRLWCSARDVAWTWSWQAYPGVWAFVVTVGFLVRAFRPIATDPMTVARRWRAFAGLSGLLLLWISLDWPVGPLGAGYLASVDAVQFIVLAMIVPPLLLAALDHARVERAVRARPRAERLLERLTAPLPVMIAFTIVMIVTHVPAVVDGLMRSQGGAFLLDLSWLVSGIVFWWPVVVGIPDRPGFPGPMRLLYLFFGTQVHLFIGTWLLVVHFPVYGTYELATRVSGLSALTDQQVAGGIMVGLTEPIVFGAMTVVFFRWAKRSEAAALAAGMQA